MLRIKHLNKNMAEYKRIKRLYRISFPKDERAPFGFLVRTAKKKNGEFLTFFDEDVFVGLAYMVCSERLAYLFYLAVDDTLRAKGYGSRILSELKERFKGKNLFLALEQIDKNAPNLSERIRRRKFYEKNGFVLLACKLREASVIYDVMSVGGDVTPDEYDELIERWSGRLLKKLIGMHIYNGEQ